MEFSLSGERIFGMVTLRREAEMEKQMESYIGTLVFDVVTMKDPSAYSAHSYVCWRTRLRFLLPGPRPHTHTLGHEHNPISPFVVECICVLYSVHRVSFPPVVVCNCCLYELRTNAPMKSPSRLT